MPLRDAPFENRPFGFPLTEAIRNRVQTVGRAIRFRYAGRRILGGRDRQDRCLLFAGKVIELLLADADNQNPRGGYD